MLGIRHLAGAKMPPHRADGGTNCGWMLKGGNWDGKVDYQS